MNSGTGSSRQIPSAAAFAPVIVPGTQLLDRRDHDDVGVVLRLDSGELVFVDSDSLAVK